MPASPLISISDLAGRLGAPEVRVIDASWYLPAAQRDGWAEYLDAHLPGARFLDLDQASDPHSPLPHMLPPPGHVEGVMRAMGIRRGDFVAVYDASGNNLTAPRIWWMLRAFGHDNVAVLDGGLRAWRAEGRPVEAGEPEDVAYGNWSAHLRNGFALSLEQVRDIVHRGGVQLVDMRSAPRFQGEEAEPRPGVRVGHIPGARNLHYAKLSRPDGRFMSNEEVRTLLAAAKIDPAKPMVATCGSGVSACALVLALHRLGIADVPVYDGSWTEWGGRTDTPVATGP